jgi:hypothetical protein
MKKRMVCQENPITRHSSAFFSFFILLNPLAPSPSYLHMGIYGRIIPNFSSTLYVNDKKCYRGTIKIKPYAQTSVTD